MLSIEKIMQISPIVPVVSIDNIEDAVPVAEALLDGGIGILELALRTDCVIGAIEQISINVPDMCIGAGTVCNKSQFKQAVDSGAKFVFSPGISDELVNVALDTKTPFIPGIATASELMIALNSGFNHCKLFPASIVGGVDILKAFLGPFKEAKFCPTGGVKIDNMNEYLALENVVAVGGTWLSDKNLIADKDFEAIVDLTKESLKLIER
jgi:2-dehydro-3-deoxyphosphogluconate aldolase/(4S)-4-hydroxy-2-oxoglutarate aldolase